ncbi:MAG: type II toxin-antitoxin system RelE/ParE family toxin [Holosporaceae bacterium]|jgi:phage-related protein|nr:type II toxin-antitoxin system RelE/ParE family toxin [Holosporaceae bacterium]
MFDIKFYRDKNGFSSVKDDLDELQKRSNTDKDSRVKLKKIYEYINLLSLDGTYLGEKYVKHIEDDILELKPTSDRIFFFYWQQGTFVLIHVFQKKTQKTPKR